MNITFNQSGEGNTQIGSIKSGGEVLQICKNPPNGDLHLKSCPFCGSSEIVYWEYETVVGPRWRIFCLGCAAGVDPGYAQQKNQLTDIWNRRETA